MGVQLLSAMNLVWAEDRLLHCGEQRVCECMWPKRKGLSCHMSACVYRGLRAGLVICAGECRGQKEAEAMYVQVPAGTERVEGL